MGILELLLALTVTLNWNAQNPSTVQQFKVYKGADVASLAPIATVTAVANQTAYSFDYNFTDATPQQFGISSVNAFGESPVTTKDAAGNLVLLGKPTAPSAISYSVH